MPFIMMAENLKIVKCWEDASYVMHTYCWIHIGATISLGWVSVSSMSKRQQFNSSILAEAELIGADDIISGFLCSIYFIEVQ